MLKTIPHIIGGELLRILDAMGHGDEILIADGNFPGGDIAKRIVSMSGHDISTVLKGMLNLIPLDAYVEYPVVLMEKPITDPKEPEIWNEYKSILSQHGEVKIEHVERYKFYERAKQAYAVVMTSEKALCANIILKKGVILSQ